MRKPPDESAVAYGDVGRRCSDSVIELAVNLALRDRARHAPVQAERGRAARPDADPQLADREAEP